MPPSTPASPPSSASAWRSPRSAAADPPLNRLFRTALRSHALLDAASGLGVGDHPVATADRDDQARRGSAIGRFIAIDQAKSGFAAPSRLVETHLATALRDPRRLVAHQLAVMRIAVELHDDARDLTPQRLVQLVGLSSGVRQGFDPVLSPLGAAQRTRPSRSPPGNRQRSTASRRRPAGDPGERAPDPRSRAPLPVLRSAPWRQPDPPWVPAMPIRPDLAW